MRFSWLTPSAPAAIAVVRAAACAELFDRSLPNVGRARFARLVDGSGTVIDETVVMRVNDNEIDIMTHGGPGVRAGVNAGLLAHGLRERADADLGGDWLRLARAASPAAAQWLLRNGSVATPFNAEFLHRQPMILLTGRTNAGKSALLNAWCGHQRAIVADIPGTTRDLVAAETVMSGWRCLLLDSAGVRESDDPLETAGQDLARQARVRADLVLYLRSPGELGAGRRNDLVVNGKADQEAPSDGRPAWSIHGLPGRSTDKLLHELSLAVLARLRLPKVADA